MKSSTNSGYKYLADDEKERFFKVVDLEEKRHRLRNKAMIYLAKYCALRVSEVTNMRLDQINLIRREVYCIRGKKGNDNTLKIIDNDVYNTLSNYMNYRKLMGIQSEFVFTSQKSNSISRKTIDKIMKEYGLLAELPEDKCHFHVLRHTRAIELAETGFDTKEIQFWLGHKNISNTEIYFRFTSKQQEALYAKFDNEVLTEKTVNTSYIYEVVKTILREERASEILT